MPSRARLEELRDDFLADDVSITDAMLEWSDEAAAAFFESGGTVVPDTSAISEPRKVASYMVVFSPRIALRQEPSLTAKTVGAMTQGTRLRATPTAADPDWLGLEDGSGFVMLRHPQHGVLVAKQADETVPTASANAPEARPPAAPAAAPTAPERSLKKTFATDVGRKACGANLKTADAAGASRDTLFDHFVNQEVLCDFHQKFRDEQIPDHLYNTDLATDTECITWCQMGGQIGPVKTKDGKRKPAAGGMRQRVEQLGGLRCVVAERDEGSDEAPRLIVVLCHGIHVLGDDLYGLAYHAATPRVRFILPAGPEPSSNGRPAGWLRTPRQWFAWQMGDGAEAVLGRMDSAADALAECVRAARRQAPEARLVMGGFSQGAAVALCASARKGLQPSGLVQLCAQDPATMGLSLAARSLRGVQVLAAAGSRDPIAPPDAAERLLAACAAEHVGGAVRPLMRFEGEHEVTPDVADAVRDFLQHGLSEEDGTACVS